MLKKALTNELQESYYMAKICYVCRKKFEDKYANDKKYCKGRDHNYQTGEHRGATHSICNLKDSIPKEIIIHFHNELNYGYHFVKKKLAKGFEWTCLGKHTERHLTVSIPVEKEVKQLVKNGAQITKGISYKLAHIPSKKELMKLNAKIDTAIKKVKHVELNTSAVLNTQVPKMI